MKTSNIMERHWHEPTEYSLRTQGCQLENDTSSDLHKAFALKEFKTPHEDALYASVETYYALKCYQNTQQQSDQ